MLVVILGKILIYDVDFISVLAIQYCNLLSMHVEDFSFTYCLVYNIYLYELQPMNLI